MITSLITMTLILSSLGYSQPQIQCAANLVQKESNFNPAAFNKKSGAAGMYQILGLKLPMSIDKQTIRFDKYIKSRYNGDMCQAWKHFQIKNWY
jgi:hypothetical protein